MWASCCGLLNEVMGTGAVRGQQAAFGGGAGPFRFAPNTDFSAYPSPAAAGTNIVCKACGLSFSVFRKKVSVFPITSCLYSRELICGGNVWFSLDKESQGRQPGREEAPYAGVTGN